MTKRSPSLKSSARCAKQGRDTFTFRNGRLVCVDPCGHEVDIGRCAQLLMKDGKPTVLFDKNKCDLDAKARRDFIDHVAGVPTVWAYEDAEDGFGK